MFQAQNRETINKTLKFAVSFKIIMSTSVTRSCFTKQHQNCKTKTKTNTTAYKTDFLVSDRSCPKTDGLRPHHWFWVCETSLVISRVCNTIDVQYILTPLYLKILCLHVENLILVLWQLSYEHLRLRQVYGSKGEGKGTLDIPPLLLKPPQKHSGMARVLKGSHSFTCITTVGMSHTCLCLLHEFLCSSSRSIKECWWLGERNNKPVDFFDVWH